MKSIIVASLLLLSLTTVAQDEEKGGFKKENLFTGGGMGLGFGSNYFQIGVNPVFGYSVTPWLDAGIVVNYNYTSFTNGYYTAEKARQSSVGGGLFTRMYMFQQFFAQAQYEQNSIRTKFIYNNSGDNYSATVSAPSLLLGIGYAGGRFPGSGRAFGYISLMYDVLERVNSPYTNSDGSGFPIIRGGIQIPLFQGGRR